MCRCCCGLCNKKLSASIEHTLCWWTWYPDISRFHNYLLEHILSGVMAFRCYKIMVLFQIFLSAQCSCMRLKTGTCLSALCSSRCIKPGSVIWCLSSFIALLFFIEIAVQRKVVKKMFSIEHGFSSPCCMPVVCTVTAPSATGWCSG